MLIVLFAIPTLVKTYPALLKPKPEVRPEGFADGQGGWPLYFAPLGFVNNRAFGMYFMLGLILDVILRLLPATANFWRRQRLTAPVQTDLHGERLLQAARLFCIVQSTVQMGLLRL